MGPQAKVLGLLFVGIKAITKYGAGNKFYNELRAEKV